MRSDRRVANKALKASLGKQGGHHCSATKQPARHSVCHLEPGEAKFREECDEQKVPANGFGEMHVPPCPSHAGVDKMVQGCRSGKPMGA